MAVTRTFSIIKPDATRRNLTGAVTKMLEDAGLRVVASKRIQMTKEQAEGFYAVHKERPFFGGLVDFLSSGPVAAMVWEGKEVITTGRKMIGVTNPRASVRVDACGVNRWMRMEWTSVELPRHVGCTLSSYRSSLRPGCV